MNFQLLNFQMHIACQIFIKIDICNTDFHYCQHFLDFLKTLYIRLKINTAEKMTKNHKNMYLVFMEISEIISRLPAFQIKSIDHTCIRISGIESSSVSGP